MKAIHNLSCNHNANIVLFSMRQRYENESHSQLYLRSLQLRWSCFLCVKDTKMKAIHNKELPPVFRYLLFSMRQRYENESHSQRLVNLLSVSECCFLCVKDTKMKAIHNKVCLMAESPLVVFYASKIRK